MGADRSTWQFPANEANKIIGWSSDGTRLENKEPGAESGNMAASVYDPQEIEADAFARANHTGTQAANTITGLATVATTGDWNDLDNRPSFGSAALNETTDFASAAQGISADSAVQPDDLATVATSGSYNDLSDTPPFGNSAGLDVGTTAGTVAAGDDSRIVGAAQASDLGDLSTKDKAAVADIDATGTPSSTTFLRGDGTWGSLSGSGDMIWANDVIDDDTFATASADTVPTSESVKAYVDASAGSGGDMTASTYDPTNVAADAFDMDNMADGSTNVAMLATERTKLSGIEASADVTDATNVAAAGAVMDGDFSSNGIMSRTGAGTYAVITNNSSNWNTAYGWGNHASAGYLTSAAIGVSVQAYDANTVKTTATQALSNKTLTDPAIDGSITEEVYTITDGEGGVSQAVVFVKIVQTPGSAPDAVDDAWDVSGTSSTKAGAASGV